MDFFYLCPKLYWRLAEISFYGPNSTWRAGRLDKVILLVWPNPSLSYHIFSNIVSAAALEAIICITKYGKQLSLLIDFSSCRSTYSKSI